MEEILSALGSVALVQLNVVLWLHIHRLRAERSFHKEQRRVETITSTPPTAFIRRR